MSKALSLFRIVELVLGVALALRVLMAGNSDWGSLYAVFLYAALSAVFLVIAAWAAVFRPAERRAAAWVMLLPVGFVVVPVMLRSAMAAPLPGSALIGLLLVTVVAALAFALLRPRKAADAVPGRLLHNTALNAFILALPIVGWLLPLGAWWYLAAQDTGSSGGGGSPGMGAAVVLVMLAAYFVVLGGASVFTSIWGWVGFRSGQAGSRAIHVWQMLVGIPGLIVGILVAAWLRSQG